MFPLLKLLQDSVAAVAPERHYHWWVWVVVLLVALAAYFGWRFVKRNKPINQKQL